jgi:hypothetical protein
MIFCASRVGSPNVASRVSHFNCSSDITGFLDGLIGCSTRYCDYNGAAMHVWHVVVRSRVMLTMGRHWQFVYPNASHNSIFRCRIITLHFA